MQAFDFEVDRSGDVADDDVDDDHGEDYYHHYLCRFQYRGMGLWSRAERGT